jgi:hypothetical protein
MRTLQQISKELTRRGIPHRFHYVEELGGRNNQYTDKCLHLEVNGTDYYIEFRGPNGITRTRVKDLWDKICKALGEL